MKRRKILSFAMALVMCISMCMPGLTAYAVDPGDTPPAEPECNCEDKCTEGSIDPVCGVCSTDGADLSKCTGTEVVSEPECDCTIKCTVDSINGDCAVCGVAEADLTQCKGAEQAQAPVLLGDPKAEINSYESLTQAIKNAQDGQDTTIQLTGDITGFDQTIEIPANKIITLDLNGYDITSTQKYNTFLSAVTVNGTLNLYDRSQNADGTITGNGGTRTGRFYLGGGIYVSAGATFNMHNGHVGGNHQAIVSKTDSSITISDTGGCGVYVADDAIFNMYGGYIEENSLGSSSYLHIGGAGVLVLGGTFNMFGGYIQNNAIEKKTATGAIMQASASGAGVSISYGAKFNMTDGYITNNRTIETSGEGCGVVVDFVVSSQAPRSTFKMSGGEISNNIIITSGLSNNGAGVFCAGDMEISGNAKITSNKIQYTATNDRLEGAGGGVYCTPTANFKMSGGEISENAADVGGGIYVYQTGDDSDGPRGKLEICDGKITGNTAERGGGIYFEQYVGREGTSKDDAFTMSGGEITGNTAERGGGIYTTVQFERTAGMLCNNTATELGDDAVIISTYWPTYAGFSLERLGSIPEDEWQLTDDCQHTIDGWYIDGCKEEYSLNPADPRWNASTTIGDEVSSCIPGKEVYAESYTGTRWQYTSAIKAAHGNKEVKTYTLTYDEADASNEYQMSEKTKSLPEDSEVLLQLDGGTLSSQPAGTYDITTNTWDIVMTQNVVAGTPTRAGYYFAGWMVQEHSGTGYDYILKARWTPEKTMQVLFDFNGGINPQDNSPFDVISFPLSLSSESLDSISTIRSQKNALADIVEKDGYLFVDWERVTTGTVSYPDYSDKTIYSDETVNIYTPSDQLVVYRAVWKEPAQYSIRFDSNGGSPVEKHIEFDESDLEAEIAFITELQNFNRPDSTRAGYILDYWYIDLLEYYISNGLISENDATVVNARAARIQAEQQYAEGEITEDEYWHTLIFNGFFYNMDVVMELQEDNYQEELIDLFGPGAKLGYGLGCYLTFMQNFEITPTITLTAKWTPVITISPVDMTIYMGGDGGYEGVVGEGGSQVTGQNSLPEPLFKISVPDGVDPADLTFTNTTTENSWKPVLVGTSSDQTAYYRLDDGTDNTPIRVQFIDQNDQVHESDDFDPTEVKELYTNYNIKIFSNENDVITVQDSNGPMYAVSAEPGTLTIRAVAEDDPTSDIVSIAPTDPVAKDSAVAVAPTGTTYTLNDTGVSVVDATPSLLFDSIINDAAHDRTGALKNKAEEKLGAAVGGVHVYEFKYLDLVDANNGNAWITASQPVDIYWGYPEGTDENTTFTVLHFKNLHRDGSNSGYDTEDINQISLNDVEVITPETTANGIKFSVGSGGFSPFAIVYTKHIITATSGENGTISPSGSVSVPEGNNQTFTITPASGYHISDVKVDGVSQGAVSTYTFENVTTAHTIEATFAKDSSGSSSGGSGTHNDYTLHYETNGGENLQSETKKVSWTKEYTDLPTPQRDGYTFAGWYRNSALTMPITGDIKVYGTVTIYAKWNKTVVDPDDTGVSDLLNTQDHKEYLHGYDTGLFGPNNDMTRAEAAQMFYNLLLDKDVPITVNFSDVPADAWYATAVNTLASLGLVEGVGNNEFAPDRTITRAEFTVIAMRFTNGDVSGENIFSDVSTNDWFYDQVVGSIQYGWITGYEDGTFRPNTTIARAEVTTIVNRMLGRSADEDYVNQHEDDLRLFPDVSQDYWAYYQIVEATNAHDYTKEGNTESWSKLK